MDMKPKSRSGTLTYVTVVVALYIGAALAVTLLFNAMALGQAKAEPRVINLPALCQEASHFASEIAHLESAFGEHVAYRAVSTNGSQVIVTVNPETLAYTVLSRLPNYDVFCIIVTGEGWSVVLQGDLL